MSEAPQTAPSTLKNFMAFGSVANLLNVPWAEKIAEVMKYYIKATSHKPDEQLLEFQNLCVSLFNLDYEIELIDNKEGQWCATYPLLLVVLLAEKNKVGVNSKAKIKELLSKGARFARVRTRFVCPVILFRGKNICRSSTLSQKLETVFQSTSHTIKTSITGVDPYEEDTDEALSESVMKVPTQPALSSSAPTSRSTTPTPEGVNPSVSNPDVSSLTQVQGFFNKALNYVTLSGSNHPPATPAISITPAESEAEDPPQEAKGMSIMDRYRLYDISLMQELSVSHICDLMTENAKKMYGVTLCSSEKKDSRQRYAKFNISVVPYPGVEFFREFDNTDPTAANELFFDWNRTGSDAAVLNISSNKTLINWSDYKKWDIITLTQNYMKLMIGILCDPSSDGLLVHCISGWDRTPTVISLIRMSLWADGQIHQSLTAEQMLFLTISYDWMLFRHSLAMRQSRGEDIFFFCFYFLEHITDPEYSVHHLTAKLTSETDSPLAKPDADSSPKPSSQQLFPQASSASPPPAGKTSANSSPLRGHPRSRTAEGEDFFMFAGDTVEYSETIDQPLVEIESKQLHYDEEPPKPAASDDDSTGSDDDVTSERILEEGAGSWQLVNQIDKFMSRASPTTSSVPAVPKPVVAEDKGKDLGEEVFDHPLANMEPNELDGDGFVDLVTTPEARLPEWAILRKERLLALRNAFMKFHKENVLPETMRMQQNSWSTWFSSFSFGRGNATAAPAASTKR